MLSFRLIKETSKNVADTTFKQSFGLAGENEKMSHDVHLAVVIVKCKEETNKIKLKDTCNNLILQKKR